MIPRIELAGMPIMSRYWFLLALACAAPAHAELPATADTRAARYYAQGLEIPLLQVRAAAELVRICAGTLQKACTEEQRKAAAGTSALVLLDALSLFPQRPAGDAAAGIASRRELEKKMGETGAALLREAGAYDRELFARVQATEEVCPSGDNPQYLASVQMLKLVNYSRFQAVPAERLAQMQIDETRREDALAEDVARWPREDCVAARKLGEFLMQLMNSKLMPWMDPARGAAPGVREFDFDQPDRAQREMPAPDDRQLAQAVAGNFVTVVATELQLMVFPESEARIKAIAEAQGFLY